MVGLRRGAWEEGTCLRCRNPLTSRARCRLSSRSSRPCWFHLSSAFLSAAATSSVEPQDSFATKLRHVPRGRVMSALSVYQDPVEGAASFLRADVTSMKGEDEEEEEQSLAYLVRVLLPRFVPTPVADLRCLIEVADRRSLVQEAWST
eukprot:46340-Hanusia_phi.AAC.7